MSAGWEVQISLWMQVTSHLDPLRREARVLLWDADGTGRDGWVDGVLTAQYASIDGFRGSVRLCPINTPWYAAPPFQHTNCHASMTRRNQPQRLIPGTGRSLLSQLEGGRRCRCVLLWLPAVA